jgi:hypothetical protein
VLFENLIDNRGHCFGLAEIESHDRNSLRAGARRSNALQLLCVAGRQDQLATELREPTC